MPVSQEALYTHLLGISDEEFQKINHSVAMGQSRRQYGSYIDDLLTPKFMRLVEAARAAKRTDEALYDRGTFAGSPRHFSPVEADLRSRLHAVDREFADLRRRFESLFRIPAFTATETTQLPGTPEQWRVRIHVPAFTVETTMGALAAARGNPTAALTWGQVHQRVSEVTSAARDESLKHIATYIVAEGHRVESAEPPDPPEYQFQEKK